MGVGQDYGRIFRSSTERCVVSGGITMRCLKISGNRPRSIVYYESFRAKTRVLGRKAKFEIFRWMYAYVATEKILIFFSKKPREVDCIY